MNYLKVKGNDGLVRDIETRAIVNTNTTDYENYINQRNSVISQRQEITRHSQELQQLKNDISEIKHLLLQVINKS